MAGRLTLLSEHWQSIFRQEISQLTAMYNIRSDRRVWTDVMAEEDISVSHQCQSGICLHNIPSTFLVHVPVVVYHNTILASTIANNRDSKETVDELVRAIEVRTCTERFFNDINCNLRGILTLAEGCSYPYQQWWDWVLFLNVALNDVPLYML